MGSRLSAFTEHADLFRCPLCGGSMHFEGSSLRCGRGHDFALAKKGYCDFAPNKHASLYTRELFESRRRIMEGRLYAGVRETLKALVRKHAPDAPVLDAGCGEGAYLKAIGEGRPRYGADLARDGVALAASGGNGLGWMVADLARLPFRDETIGCLLNILSPAAYPEFCRVLRPDGIVIKVIPGDRYLREIRAITGKQPHSAAPVRELFESRFDLLETAEADETFSLTAEEADDLFKMTPLTEHTDSGAAPKLSSVTINLVFLAGAKKKA